MSKLPMIMSTERLRWPSRVFGGLVCISFAAIIYALFIRTSTGAAFYKMMRSSQGFTAEQRDWVSSWLSHISGFYLILLGLTNGLWIVGAWYLMRRLNRRDEDRV
jgi:hypothetical protein